MRPALRSPFPDPPLRLGLILERASVPFPYRPGVTYRGVDRLPFVPTPEEEEELDRLRRSALVSVWHQYGDALFTGELHTDRELAVTLQRQFLEEGLDVEVIYGEVITVPKAPDRMNSDIDICGTLDRLRRHNERAAPCPDGALLLGYDVSYPLPSFHSALVQPGLHDLPDAPPFDVNEAGLLGDLELLRAILQFANMMDSSWRPFCGIAVYSIPDASR